MVENLKKCQQFEMFFLAGETMLIFAKVNNASSRDMTPKFSLVRSVQFRAQGDTKNEEYTVEKAVDKVIKPHTQHEVRCEMKIPTDEMLSIENCEIISVTHQLKVQHRNVSNRTFHFKICILGNFLVFNSF